METAKSVIKATPFFRGLKAKYVDLITKSARNRKLKSGAYLFKRGERAVKFYIIRKGEIAIDVISTNRKTVTIETIGKGDVLGWSWIVPPNRWRFTTRAVKATEVIEINAANLKKACDENPELGYEMLKRIAKIFTQRLELTRLHILERIYG